MCINFYSQSGKKNTKTTKNAVFVSKSAFHVKDIDLIFEIIYNLDVIGAYYKKIRKKDYNMKKCKKLLLKCSRMLAPLAMALAVVTVNSTCFFYTYQPEVPEKLKHD